VVKEVEKSELAMGGAGERQGTNEGRMMSYVEQLLTESCASFLHKEKLSAAIE